MSNSYFETQSNLIPKTKLVVSEKDKFGKVIQIYTGYYNPRSFTVKLYSDGGKGKVISAMLVRTKKK